MRRRCGYVEGFYGRLLGWNDRHRIVDGLAKHRLGSYLYAPKEDARHRFRWREPYDDIWHSCFSKFCSYAKDRQVTIIAGVAPGLDFNFTDLPDGKDFHTLLEKCRTLINDGADELCLLMDDIDADFHTRNVGFQSEGEAHAQLANAIGDALGDAIQVVPRIYANELVDDEPNYLSEFISTLNPQNPIIYCGTDVVSESIRRSDTDKVFDSSNLEIVFWDNLYANDYCPRRLFVGPWMSRENATPVLLNATGMIETDCLLLDIMGSTISMNEAALKNESTDRSFLAKDSKIESDPAELSNELALTAWRSTLTSHDVPEVFYSIANYFYHPVCNSSENQLVEAASEEQYAALEVMLWQWKTPLSREWYPYLMGLKHDLLLNDGRLPEDRIRKTQLSPLATHLLKQ